MAPLLRIHRSDDLTARYSILKLQYSGKTLAIDIIQITAIHAAYFDDSSENLASPKECLHLGNGLVEPSEWLMAMNLKYVCQKIESLWIERGFVYLKSSLTPIA